jgi:hypothetical protein
MQALPRPRRDMTMEYSLLEAPFRFFPQKQRGFLTQAVGGDIWRCVTVGTYV